MNRSVTLIITYINFAFAFFHKVLNYVEIARKASIVQDSLPICTLLSYEFASTCTYHLF